MGSYLFTSESVARGHPDKVADLIADAILDACLSVDCESRVACEVFVSSGLLLIAGEISTRAIPDYRQIARDTLRDIGYEDPALGFDYRSCAILVNINQQSPDIAAGLGEGAGDQGMMFGYACEETSVLMPLPIMLAHQLQFALLERRLSRDLPYLRPDAKTQVTVEYSDEHVPLRVHAVVLSTQHAPEVTHRHICADMQQLIREVISPTLLDENTHYYINPTGRFVLGGPQADCGLTGRKLMVDTYGGASRHGGGAFSGKDPTKVDRSGAYAMRYVAKHLVAAKLARRCEVQVSYAIGVPLPLSLKVETFGTSALEEDHLKALIQEVFDLSPKGIIEMLDLRRPIYKNTAFGGHFGREEPTFTWEKINKLDCFPYLFLK